MAVVLGLLANVSIHGTIVAMAFAALYVRDVKARATDPAALPARRKDMRIQPVRPGGWDR